MITPQTLSTRTVLRLSGDTVLAFLHNILTCDVAELPLQRWAYGALLSPQGKIQHDIFVGHDGTTVFIDCAASQGAGLLQKLKLYRLRAKIEINRDDSLRVVASSEAMVGVMSAVDPRHSTIGFRSIMASPLLHDGDYNSHRIALGLADSDADIGVNQAFPHEANLDLCNGVSFSKGCYVGQEVVSRMQHRGTARSRILPISGSAELISGAAIVSNETSIGTILSTNGIQGLALIRIDRWREASESISAGGALISLRNVDWLAQITSEPKA